jgi:hypothetical protein
MSLHPDWLATLPKAIWGWNGKPHEFGTSDCVVFVRDLLLAIGARDPLPSGITWSTRQGALRVLKRLGGIATQLARVYPTIEPRLLRSGDVLVRLPSEEYIMGAVYLVHSARAWSMLEGDESTSGGLVSEDLTVLINVDESSLDVWQAFSVQGDS